MKRSAELIIAYLLLCAAFFVPVKAENAALMQAVGAANETEYSLHYTEARDEDKAISALGELFDGVYEEIEILGIEALEFIAPVYTDGIRLDGKIDFVVEMSSGNDRMTTDVLTANISTFDEFICLKADKYYGITGKEIRLYAEVIGSSSSELMWCIESGDDQETHSGASSFSFTPENVGIYTVYCYTGGAYSNKAVINIASSFVPVTGISVGKTSFYPGETLAISANTNPVTSTESEIVWSLKDDGGTGAVLSGRMLTAEEAGTITLTATVPGGSGEEDFTLDFIFECLLNRDEDPESEIMLPCEIELDTSFVYGVESVVAGVSGEGSISVTSISDKTLDGLFERSARERISNEMTVTTLKLVYGDDIVSDDLTLHFKDAYSDKSVYVMIVTEDGKIAVNTHTVSDSATLTLKSVNPDMIVVWTDTTLKKAYEEYVPYILSVAAVIPFAVFLIARYHIKRSGKNGSD